MQRIPEPQLMDEEEQARAYAAADFEEPHSRFIELFFAAFPEHDAAGYVIDLGCGPGDIAMRFARAFPQATVHGIDGAEAMLRCGRRILDTAGDDLRGRVDLFQCLLPDSALPRSSYDTIISNSLLHHLPDPDIIWQSINNFATPGAPVFIMDLLRPQTAEAALRLVDLHMPSEPEILRRDFYNSLLAAFTLDEVREQIGRAGLDGFNIKQVSDRHQAVWGRMRTIR